MNIILAIYCAFILAIAVPAASKCVPAFSTPANRPYYDVCERADCIIFRTEPPFVVLDPAMKDIEHQRPFLCSEYLKQHNGDLHGASFQFIQRVKPLKDAYCVWAGPNCGFDEMLDFMKNSALQGYKHRWMIGSVLYTLPYRISNYTIPSLPLYEDRLLIIGPPIQVYTTVGEAWNTLLKPFTFKGWIYIWGCFLMHLALRLAIACICTELHQSTLSVEWNQLAHRLFDISNTYKRGREREERWWRRLNKFWLIIATIFVVTTMVFWEVAIAAQVYETRVTAPAEDIDPSRFAIIRNSAQLTIFKGLVNSTEQLWHEFDTIEEVYKVLLDESNDIDYTVKYGVRNRYQMKRNPEMCANLRRYDEFSSQVVENRKPPSLSGVWFYSSRISLNRRIEIDKAISSNKKNGRFERIIDELAGEDVADFCRMKPNRIDWVLLGLLHAVIVGLPQIAFVFTVAAFAIYCCIRRIRISLLGSEEKNETLGDDRINYDAEDITESFDLALKLA